MITMFFLVVISAKNVFAVNLPEKNDIYEQKPDYNNLNTIYGVITVFDKKLEKKM